MTVQDPTAAALSEAERDALVLAGRRVVADILDLADQLNDIKRRLREGVPVGTAVEIDGQKFALQPNRRFDLDRALALLSDEQRKMCEVATYDAKKVKAMLPPVVLESAMMDAGEPKVLGL